MLQKFHLVVWIQLAAEQVINILDKHVLHVHMIDILSRFLCWTYQAASSLPTRHHTHLLERGLSDSFLCSRGYDQQNLRIYARRQDFHSTEDEF